MPPRKRRHVVGREGDALPVGPEATASPDDLIASEQGALSPAAEIESSVPVTTHSSSLGRTHVVKRRRALAACQLCRTRKTKCDNNRPACGYCLFHGATCVYSEQDVAPHPLAAHPEGASNHVLLDRLNHVVNLIEDLRYQPAQALRPEAATPTFTAGPPLYLNGQAIQDGTRDANAESAFSDGGFGQLEVSELAARTSACESILRWPILREELGGDSSVTSFPLQVPGDSDEGEGGQGRYAHGSVLQEENIWPLCQRFVELIHVKNPVLEVSSLRRYARQATEYGPGWDGQGCLVLLACALASVATPYENTESARNGTHNGDMRAGQVYFTAAKRRLGTLQNSLIAVQCYYFAGLYEKFAVRPFAAWLLLQQACVQAQAYLYAKSLRPHESNGGNRRLLHIEQRLYWSCVKAECELRADLQLPASGLLRFKYPDLFPFLSFPSASDATGSPEDGRTMETESPASVLPSPGGSLQPEEERSWLYYLAEISLRKIMNRILEGLYSRGEQYWRDDIRRVIVQHLAFSEELAMWRANLPPSIRFSDTEAPRNELSFFLKTRYLGCLEWIHRPFLFYACHRGEDDAMMAQVLPLAQSCVDVCSALIPLISKHHRHGGIWSLLRRAFGCSLMLAAADKTCHMLPARRLADWRALIMVTIQAVERWETGAKDLAWMKHVLLQLSRRAAEGDVDSERQ